MRNNGVQVKNVRVSSLTLRHAAPTYMANYSVGSGGDYAVHRGGAVSLIGTENVTQVMHRYYKIAPRFENSAKHPRF